MTNEQSISLKLKIITDRIRQLADIAFSKYALTGPQVGYLNYIHWKGDEIAQKDLEKAFGVSHPTIVGIVSRLKEKGFLVVTTDPKDRRNRILTLTDKALCVTSELKNGEKNMDNMLVHGLTPDEMKDLGRYLDILADNLKIKLKAKEKEQDEQ